MASFSLFVLWITATFCHHHVHGANILLVGDSHSEFMGKTMESYCPGSTVGNAGISGSTAAQWATYDTGVISSCMMGVKDDSMPWDIVYISVGGNDVLHNDCTLDAAELKTLVEAAVTNIVEVIAPGAARYVLTGYCMPTIDKRRLEFNGSDRSSGGGCSDPSGFSIYSQVYNNDLSVTMPDDAELYVFDSTDLCGGSDSSFSNGLYFDDMIHLNSKGYCQMFTPSWVQMALSCDEWGEEDIELNDCDSLSYNIYGKDGECTPNPLSGPLNNPTMTPPTDNSGLGFDTDSSDGKSFAPSNGIDTTLVLSMTAYSLCIFLSFVL